MTRLQLEYAAVVLGSVVGLVVAEAAAVTSALASLAMVAAGAVASLTLVRARYAETARGEAARKQQIRAVVDVVSAAAADDARTVRLVDALGAAAEKDPSLSFEDGSFGAVVTTGLSCDRCVPLYPPPGHTYPGRI